MIQRIFHPIGQGAFYSERHNGFNIVYDCGNWRNSRLADMVVKQSFNNGEIIDILFISHFDYDHVSKIETLKKHCQIKNVILPLLHRDEKLLLSNFYKPLNFDNLVLLINNPDEYFGENTKVVLVRQNNNLEMSLQNEQLDIENIGNEIESATIITSRNLDWVFIPFNFDYNNRNVDLVNAFNSEGLDIEVFKTNLDYAIGNRTKIRSIYNKLSGKINQNSMIVYSGPLNNNYHINFINRRYAFPFYNHFQIIDDIETERVACVYTGDSDLNIANIKVIFRLFWDKVGTIQIPHHGDIKSFKNDILDDENYFCPMSFGINNSYGHPSSKVIADIYSNYCYPIFITERLNSGFIEIIG